MQERSLRFTLFLTTALLSTFFETVKENRLYKSPFWATLRIKKGVLIDFPLHLVLALKRYFLFNMLVFAASLISFFLRLFCRYEFLGGGENRVFSFFLFFEALSFFPFVKDKYTKKIANFKVQNAAVIRGSQV